MGLFDKKKSADFGSPVEQIDLSSQSSRGLNPGGTYTPQAMAPPSQESPAVSRYGIREAIELMRLLPGENVDLVVQVVKRTLESTQIRISLIIDDASARQADIEARIAVLRQEIGELDREISTRRVEITRLESDHQETSLVKERLLLAERLSAAQTNPSGAPRQAPAAGAPGPERSGIFVEKSGVFTEKSGTVPAGAVPMRAPVENNAHVGPADDAQRRAAAPAAPAAPASGTKSMPVVKK